MECLTCGLFCPPDPETGYDGDDICPTCAAEGFDIGSDGEILAPEPEDVEVLR